MIELHLFVFAVVGFGLGWLLGMSGLALTSSRFLAVATIEFSLPTAIGTAIGGTAFNMIPAALNYYRTQNIHIKIFTIMATVGAGGAILGSFFTNFIPSVIIISVIMILMVYGLVSLLRSKAVKRNVGHYVLNTNQYVKEGIVAFGLGLLVGMFGVLLVNVRLLTVMNKFKLDPKTVIGTSLAVACVLGSTSFLGHAFLGNVNFLLLFILSSTGMIGALIGAKFTNCLGQKKLKILLVVLFLFMIVYLFIMLSNILLRPSVITCSTCF